MVAPTPEKPLRKELSNIIPCPPHAVSQSRTQPLRPPTGLKDLEPRNGRIVLQKTSPQKNLNFQL